MKKLFLIMLISGFVFSYNSFFCFAEGNLVVNPSFEQENGGKPDGWEPWMYIPGGSNLAVESGQGHTGNKFISITSNSENDARFKQTIPVKENAIYKLSCWARTENVGKNKTGAIISILDYVDSSKDLKDTNNEWQHLEMYAKIGSGINSIGLTIGLGGYGNMNTGKAYFDDVSVEEISKAPDGVVIAQIIKQQTSVDQPDSDKNSKPSDSSSIIIILAIIGVAIIGGIAYFIFAGRRSKGNSGEDGDNKKDEFDENSEYEEEDSEQDDDDSYLDD